MTRRQKGGNESAGDELRATLASLEAARKQAEESRTSPTATELPGVAGYGAAGEHAADTAERRTAASSSRDGCFRRKS